MSNNGLGPILADPVLALAADVLDDIEVMRCANENRLRTLTTPVDQRGDGLYLAQPDVFQIAVVVAGMLCGSDVLTKLGWERPRKERGKPCCLEHSAISNLENAMRHHPLGAWVKSQTGVGEKQAARLLGTIRDPYWNDLHDRPRKLRELWAYCGFHVLDTGTAPIRKRRKRGEDSSHDENRWHHNARRRVWLIAASCIKQADSPYRKVYDDTRTKYAEAIHQQPCVRCGPSGKPAQPGSPLSAGHQHARAMRAMCKEILRDLWEESRHIHESFGEQRAA